MAQIFLTDINLSKNELQNAAIQNLATAPASPVAGQIYFDTADAEMKVWDGTAWIGMGGDITSITAGLGLTGTAASGDVTLDVGAGSGITVNADTIDVRYDNTSIELDGNGDLSLKATGVTGATYGNVDGTSFPVFAVDADGRITSASSVSLQTSWTLSDGTNSAVVNGGDTLTVGSSDSNIVLTASEGDALDVKLADTVSITTELNAGSNFKYNDTIGLYLKGEQLAISPVEDPYDVTFIVNPSAHVVQVGSGFYPGALNVYGTIFATGNVSIDGDLIVSGTTITKLSEEVLIEDNIITLNSNETGAPTQSAGIEVERGTSTNVSLTYAEGIDRWQFTNDGISYYSIPINSEYNNYAFSIDDETNPAQSVNNGEALTFRSSDGSLDISVGKDGAGTIPYVDIVHSDTSSATSTTNTSGLLEVVKNVTVDGFGHVTDVASEDLTVAVQSVIGGYRLSRDLSSTDPLVSVDGTGTIFTVTHGMSTHDIIVQIYDKTTLETVYADITRDTVNNDIVKISFNTAPGDGVYRVSIIKA